jgi:hypothetical protein
MRLYTPRQKLMQDPRLAPDEAYGRVIFSIPWRGRRWGLVGLIDGRWFFGFFARGDR